MIVAVVLGNRMNDDGSLSDTMLIRLNLALKLYSEKRPDKIIVSGGVANVKAGVAEADEMKKWLVKNGIPGDIIVIENKSLTTKENARFSAPIICNLKADKLILCSTKEHIDRFFLNPVKLFKKALKEKGRYTDIEVYTNR